MKEFAKSFVGLIVGLALVAILMLVAILPSPFHVYDHRYRLSMAVEVDGELRHGSGVIEVSWRYQKGLFDAPPLSSTVRGHAPLVDLRPYGVLVATLTPYGDAQDTESVGVNVLALRGFGIFADRPRSFPPTIEGLRAQSRVTGRAELKPGNFPQLIWIRDIGDARSAVRVPPADLGTAIGPGVRLRSMSIEVTDDPVVRTLPSTDPWIEQFRSARYRQALQHQDRLNLSSLSFER